MESLLMEDENLCILHDWYLTSDYFYFERNIWTSHLKRFILVNWLSYIIFGSMLCSHIGLLTTNYSSESLHVSWL